MSAERKNLTFATRVLELAQDLMKLRRFDDLSGFLSQLVREEWERRHGPATFDARAAEFALNDTSTAAPPPVSPAPAKSPTRYTKSKKDKRRVLKLPPEHRS
jgi:hypothetical protein